MRQIKSRSCGRAQNPFDREGQMEQESESLTKKQELRSFLFLSVVMAPILAVIFVAGYGFVVWMFQLLAGPPGS